MLRRIFYNVLLSLFTTISATAGSGKFFQVISSGETFVLSVNFTLCLNINGKYPISCQNYTTSQANLSITTTISNHIYRDAGIKINTPGYTYTNQTLIKSNISIQAAGYTAIGPVSDTQAATGTLVAHNVTTFNNPGPATYTVANDVRRLTIVATGGGGGATNFPGGNGGVVMATISVTPGEVLDLYVGGGGATGFLAGGGGGSSNVNAGKANQIIAGGGGASGGCSDGCFGGTAAGGNGGGDNTSSGSNGQGDNNSGGQGGANGFGGNVGAGGGGTNGGDGNGGAGGDGGKGAIGGIGSGNGFGGTGSSNQGGAGGGGGFGGGGGGGGGIPGDGGGGGGGSTGPIGSVFSVSNNGGILNQAGGDGSIVITANP